METRNAEEWLSEALEGVRGQTWGTGNLPHGTLHLPKERLVASGTLEVPFRHCLQGPDLHTLKLWGIEAAEQFPLGDPLVRSGLTWSAQRVLQAGREPDYNGNFGTIYRDMFLECGNRSAGLYMGGAQCSLAQNLTIRHAAGAALKVMNGSTRVHVVDVDIENGEPIKSTRIGTGIEMDRVRGVLIENVNLHCVSRGIVANDGASVTVLNPTLEKVSRVEVSALGFTGVGWNWQWPSDTPFDFTGNPGGTRVEVAFSKLPGTTLYYLDNRGQKRELVTVSGQFTRSRQVFMEINTRWNRWLKRTSVSVDVKTWSS